MSKATILRKGACAVATAALVGAMVPAAALADDDTQTSSGTGTTEVTSSSIEVVYDKDCSWTATYPTSVSLAKQTDGTASASITFNVKGLIDADHQVTITPASTSITLTGQRHSGELAATIAGPSSGAAAAAVNTEAGADVSGSASATADAVSAAAVDTYKGTTTFKIKCAKPAVEAYTVTVKKDDGTTLATLSNVAKGTAWSVTEDDNGDVLAIGDNSYTRAEVGYTNYVWMLGEVPLKAGDSGTITADSTFTAGLAG